MKIFEFGCDSDNFHAVYPTDHNDLDKFQEALFGRRFGSSWHVSPFKRAARDNESFHAKAIWGDFVGVTLDIGLSENTKDKLGHVFDRHGELLPIWVLDLKQNVYFFNFGICVDAVNEANSVDLWYLFDFDTSKIGDAALFRVTQARGYRFCTQAFKDRVEALGLTGLSFRLVHSDEPGWKAQWQARVDEKRNKAEAARLRGDATQH